MASSPQGRICECLFALLVTTGFCVGIGVGEVGAADLLAYEGFDYTTGSLDGASGGQGWSGSWDRIEIMNDSSVVAGSLVPPLDSSELCVEGNAAFTPHLARIGRFLDVSPGGPLGTAGLLNPVDDIGADGTTLYISYLQQPDQTGASWEFEFHRGNLDDGGRIGGIGNDTGGTDVQLRAPDTTFHPIGPASTNVNFWVVRFDFNAGEDDIYVYRNPGPGGEPPAPSLVRLARADMSFDGISFGAFGLQPNAVKHDELRLGLTWESVMPGADIDDDGLCANEDNCPARPNPDQDDADVDGVGDVCDNCPGVPNGGQNQRENDGFVASAISTAANGAVSVYATDLDGDGDADVLSASKDDDKIAWYENLGGGSFGAQEVISTAADSARSVYATDLDGDGDADVLSASYSDYKLAWYENQGGGTFGAQQVISMEWGPSFVYAADLDGDGDADVLLASDSPYSGEDMIVWYENLGGGNFGTLELISTAVNSPTSIYATDLDGDGDADVLSASSFELHNLIAWYENLGGGDFGAQRVLSTEANGAVSVYATDVDGDGDADVLSASKNDDKIAWYENQGGGSFGAQQVISEAADGASSVHATDLDSDGDADVLSALHSGNRIAWYENLGGGSFGAQRVISTVVNGPTSAYATDLDGDGDADVLSASADDKIVWYQNGDGFGDLCDNCPDLFNPDQADADIDDAGDVCDNCLDAINPFQTDSDGDGSGDVCDDCPLDPDDDTDADGVCGELDNCPGALNSDQADADDDGVGDACDSCPGIPNGGQDQSESDGFIASVISTAANGAASVYATDLDGDGDADVLSASENDDKIAWYENLGDGSFGEQRVISAAALGALSVYATDLDGDGDVDVLSASLLGDEIAWYENLGDGSFGAQQAISTAATFARSVYAVDLDGDGDADVLSASSTAVGRIAWYENLGGGSFGAQQVISRAADGAASVYATDIDGDGDADVLSASFHDDKIAWCENLGDGSFGTQHVISTGADGASSVFATDLDGDGDADVLSGSENDDKIAWYENLGGGIFGAQQVISTSADGSSSVYATDLDGDGDVDVLSASSVDDKIAWYENLGGGTFAAQQVISWTADGASSVYAIDLDGDGDADVLSASLIDDKIAWYRNGDGFGDVCDNCPNVLNPDQADAEIDGTGDACDNCPDVINPWQTDADGDGFGNVCDDCPLHADPDQEDTDGDGIGDACNDAEDSDGDEWSDALDNCPILTNPEQDPVPFAPVLLAPSKSQLAWGVTLDHVFAKGDFTTPSDISTYPVSYLIAFSGANRPIPNDPPSGRAFWYLLKPDCDARFVVVG